VQKRLCAASRGSALLDTSAQRKILPSGALPRGLSRAHAALYVGISPTLFDRAVVEGKLPKPFRLFGRVMWDLRKLDHAITELDAEDVADDVFAKMAL
jgi:predicted DNA-binding transcriptional regulator AlpA